MLREVAQKLRRAPILGLLVTVVLLATACGSLGTPVSPEPATTGSVKSTPSRDQRLRTRSGQRIRFDRISLEQGLSQSVVNCILQDSKGFMWFGTEDGLNRYDGYEFRVYKTDPENHNTLSDNFVQSISEDPEGKLWIGTFAGGLNRFDRETEQFTRNRHDLMIPIA